MYSAGSSGWESKMQWKLPSCVRVRVRVRIRVTVRVRVRGLPTGCVTGGVD